jgi:hypothetical protein
MSPAETKYVVATAIYRGWMRPPQDTITYEDLRRAQVRKSMRRLRARKKAAA